jgi:hypothetical protein
MLLLIFKQHLAPTIMKTLTTKLYLPFKTQGMFVSEGRFSSEFVGNAVGPNLNLNQLNEMK